MGIWSKLKKHRILARHQSIRPFLPETHLLNQQTLFYLLRKYPVLYLKPDRGTGGGGIIRIRRGRKAYHVQAGVTSRIVQDRRKLYSVVTRLTGRRRYLVQQGISMVTIKRRPIDYRLLVLKPGTSWEVMGIMGKWAAPNKIVTNYCRGGRPIRLFNSLRRSMGMSEQQCRKTEQRIFALGLQVARAMNPYSLRELGLDLAIDRNLRIYLLEVNTGPQFKLFRFHADRTLHRKIAGYVRRIRSRRR
ncbi:YheC/YheD family protein [Brevibacillus sp. H7]|uniref:YheC/YheD family protein n=1 Tax=Brevibacillus sp. H7 TaxID=3349138 RepID=UPI0038048D70